MGTADFTRVIAARLAVAFACAAIGVGGAVTTPAWAAEVHHDHHQMPMPGGMGDEVKRTMADYAVPLIKLVRDDGTTVSLSDELNDGRPVVLDFMYTNCIDVCPLTSQVFAQFQARLGKEAGRVNMVSISIDPDQDTPAVLREYAKKYGASPYWRYYTGTVEASVTAQRAFNVYLGDKMAHPPVTLLRAAPGKRWLRLEGFLAPDELLREYRKLVASQ